ncbi:hypothetical protein HK099_003518 [Clydaea vesicula]|uniref:RING-type domain-containing protein n=1 Tax=Clydaea vesicula TaxID=447962 RepID=A0AAD5Y1H0_9FUNG|nr:hypothetical protein HK099_003518 [Clydaea vesicula]
MEVDTSCSICFDEYEVGASLRELNCKHVFHKDCIDGWLVQSGHRTCPLCVQAAIRKEDEDVDGGYLEMYFVMFPYFILMSILILWIVYLSSSPKVVEFLRAKGLSPTELERLRTFHFTGNEVGVMESENSSNVTNQFQPPLKDDVNEQCTIELDKVAPSEETGLPK